MMSTATVSSYEKLRLQKIARNEAMLKALGLDPTRLTVPAVGKRAPISPALRQRRLQRAAIQQTAYRRRSARIATQTAAHGSPDYKEENDVQGPSKRLRRSSEKELSPHGNARDASEDSGAVELSSNRRRKRYPRAVHNVPRSPKSTSATKSAKVNSRSCRFMSVDVEKLQAQDQLGKFVTARTTQIKASVMQAAAVGGVMPTFSRMSGIQEWENAVMLFVNVYGGCYKNVFLDGGYVPVYGYVR